MNRVEINPELLRWARKRAGLDIDALVGRFPKIDAWEHKAANPTLKQLERYAAATFTPIGFLFLQEPPAESVPIPDFRTINNLRMGNPSPDLLDTIYLCQQRQEWYRDYGRSMGHEALTLAGSLRVTDDVVAAAATIRKALRFDLDEQKKAPTWTDALRRFIEQADVLGILVMCSGVVGSNNRRRLDPEEFRGFALADPLAPLIFINGADTKAAQMFTLAHELAHIWLGQSAVSDAHAMQVPDNAVERWCNRVAAELLVPLDVMHQEYDKTAELRSETDRLAKRFKVSTLVVLRRMHDAGGLTTAQLWEAYRLELERLRAIPKGNGGDFYLTLGARASKTFARALVISTLEGRTPFTEAFRLLGFKKMATFSEVGRNLGVGY